MCTHRSRGYRYVNGILENQDQFLKRMSGIMRLYSSILITKSRRGQTDPHPHGISHGWLWLTNVLNLGTYACFAIIKLSSFILKSSIFSSRIDPLPDICATLIYELLVTAGANLWAEYKTQFHKILLVIQCQYMQRLNRDDPSGPKARLEELVTKILKENRIDPVADQLPANFW